MTTFTATYQDAHVGLGVHVDVMAATLAAASKIPLPTRSADGKPLHRGEHFDTSWWIAEDGTGRVRINHYLPSSVGSIQYTHAVYVIEAVRAESAFSIEPPRKATTRHACAAGSTWTDGSARLVMIPSGELLELSPREWAAVVDGAAASGFRVRKLELGS